MDNYNSNKLSFIINNQLHLQESIREKLAKAKALFEVALESDLLNYSPIIVHYYLWTVSDVVKQAFDASELAIDTLLKKQKENIPLTKLVAN